MATDLGQPIITLVSLPHIVVTNPVKGTGYLTGESIPPGAELFPANAGPLTEVFLAVGRTKFSKLFVAFYRASGDDDYRPVAVDILPYEEDHFCTGLREVSSARELEELLSTVGRTRGIYELAIRSIERITSLQR